MQVEAGRGNQDHNSTPAPPKSHKLNRSTFRMSRELEFFTEKELQIQIGHPKRLWPLALLKELIDNGLDACESVGTPPYIKVEWQKDFFSVEDNGPGIPPEILETSLDYSKRVSDKINCISPSRGALGNAWKSIWAAPMVADGERGHIEVISRGIHHKVEVSLDRIGQKPNKVHEQKKCIVRNGTFVKIHYPDLLAWKMRKVEILTTRMTMRKATIRA
jgi:DNA topoisomerase VI subunit B